jgi:hypothetical protein
MIQKKREGYYVLMHFEAPPTLIAELNRRYKLATDTIMRSIVLQLKKGQINEILESGPSFEPPASTFDSEREYAYGEEEYPEEYQPPVASTEE